MTAAQHERLRRMRERAVIRSWQYRQRQHAQGVWYRLRRVLVDAARAFVISDADADELERLGACPLPVGRELAPEKRIFFVTLEELEPLAARELPVQLTTAFLQAGAIALLRHAPRSEPDAGSSRTT